MTPYAFSFSIDLCRSTEAKKFLQKHDSEDRPRWAEKGLAQYIARLTSLECKIHDILKEEKIEIDELYLIKVIGDEFWFMCFPSTQWEGEMVPDTVLKLTKSLLRVAELSYPIIKGDEQLDMPVKVYLDAVENFTDIQGKRVKEVSRLFSSEQLMNEGADDRFLLGDHEKTKDGGLFKRFRWDPIGPDIDHFFRVNKFSRPGLLSIGKRLIDLMINENKDVNIPRIHEEIQSENLKGIGEPYTVYHLLPSKLNKMQVENDGLEDTRLYLATNGYLNLKWYNENGEYSPTKKWINYHQS